jgi:hypothetical protein
MSDVGYTHNARNVGEPNSKSEARNPKQARIPKIQMTETHNEDAYTVVALSFHAGRASKPKTPGVEAGRYNVRTSDSSCFGHLNLTPWSSLRICVTNSLFHTMKLLVTLYRSRKVRYQYAVVRSSRVLVDSHVRKRLSTAVPDLVCVNRSRRVARENWLVRGTPAMLPG